MSFAEDKAEGCIGPLAAARQGDEDAMRTLLARFWPHAYRIAFSVLQDHHRAEDAAQEACARILTNLRTLRHEEAFCAWARQIVVHAACQSIRSSWREMPGVPLADRSAPTEANDEVLTLDAALNALQPAYRVPLVLHYYHGLTSAEIGRELGIAAGTVRFRLMTARDRLKTALSPADESR